MSSPLASAALVLAVMAFAVGLALGRDLDRVERRLDLLETTTTTSPVRAQAGQPSRPTTTIGACVVVRGFPVGMSVEDAERVGGERCER